MNSMFRSAFWALGLSVALPMGLFVAAELWPGRTADLKLARTAEQQPVYGEPDCGVRVPRDPDMVVSSTDIPSTESLRRRRGGGSAPTQLMGIEPLADLPMIASKPDGRTRLSSVPVSQRRILEDDQEPQAEPADEKPEPEPRLESSRAPRERRDQQVFLVPRVEPDDVFSGTAVASDAPPVMAALPPEFSTTSPRNELELLPADPAEPVAAYAGGDNLDLQLQRIQQHLDQISQWQLSQSQQSLKSEQLQQATQLVQQLQQQQLGYLEQQLQSLRKSPPVSPGTSAGLPDASGFENTDTDSADEIPEIPLTLQDTKPLVADPPDKHPPAAKSMVLKASPEGSGRYSFEMKDAPVTEVLELLGRLSGKNILPAPEISGTLTANLQRVELDEALAAILKARGYEQSREGDFVYIRPAGEAAEQVVPLQPVTKVFHPNHLSAQELRGLILPVLTRDIGQVSMTGPQSESAAGNSPPLPAGNDVIVVRDFPAVLELIDAILRETDVPPPQVSIEAIVLSVQLTDAMPFGVSFTALENRRNALFADGQWMNPEGTPVGADNNPLLPGSPMANAGLKCGVIRQDPVVFIETLQSMAPVELVARPRLVVLNRQRAELLAGDRLGYRTHAVKGKQALENVQFLDSGTRLKIRPLVSRDGYIRMEIQPELSSACLDPRTRLPYAQMTNVSSQVLVRDGSTIIVGGLIESQEVDCRRPMRGLGSLPLVGKAFRKKELRTVYYETLVLITPRVVPPEELVTSPLLVSPGRVSAQITESARQEAAPRLEAVPR